MIASAGANGQEPGGKLGDSGRAERFSLDLAIRHVGVWVNPNLTRLDYDRSMSNLEKHSDRL